MESVGSPEVVYLPVRPAASLDLQVVTMVVPMVAELAGRSVRELALAEGLAEVVGVSLAGPVVYREVPDSCPRLVLLMVLMVLTVLVASVVALLVAVQEAVHPVAMVAVPSSHHRFQWETILPLCLASCQD